MFGDTVMGVDHHHFEAELAAVKKQRKVKLDTDLDVDGLKEVCQPLSESLRKAHQRKIPHQPA